VNFLVDNQLPDALRNFFTEQGHCSCHVLGLRMDEASDLEIWDYADKGNWIVVSKDEDFLHLANRPGDTGKLLWVRIGNCPETNLVAIIPERIARNCPCLRPWRPRRGNPVDQNMSTGWKKGGPDSGIGSPQSSTEEMCTESEKR